MQPYIAKSFENLAILSTLHLHTKYLVICEGCKVLIEMLMSAHTLPIIIQPHKPHKINYENSPINLYNLVHLGMFSQHGTQEPFTKPRIYFVNFYWCLYVISMYDLLTYVCVHILVWMYVLACVYMCTYVCVYVSVYVCAGVSVFQHCWPASLCADSWTTAVR